MHLNYIITFFIATFFSAYGNPVQNTVYNDMKLSEKDSNLKCPYIRKTKFFKPEPEFLSKCASLQAAQSITKLNMADLEDVLCLLYYDNFIHLCYVSNNFSNAAELLPDKKIDEVLKAYQSSNEVCGVLQNVQAFSNLTKIDVIEEIRKYFEENKKCQHMCIDLDESVRPICSWTASMINITKELHQQVQNMLSEKGGIPKTKPPYTEPNEDLANSKQNPGSTLLQNMEPNAPLSNKDQGNSGNHQSSETQHSKTQTVDNSETNYKTQPQPGSSTKQGTEVQPPIVPKQSPAAPINGESENYARQQEAEEEKVSQLKTTSTVTQIEVQDNKSEDKEKTVGVQQNSEVSQTNNNSNVDNKMNDSSKETAQSIQPFPAEDTNTLQKKTNVNHEETDPAIKTEKKPAVENIPQLEPPKESGNIGEQSQFDKLSTKNDDGIAYNNQLLPDSPDDDLDMDSPQANGDGDYNSPVDTLPKSDEVKTKPVEKSKPLETDEDGPSFAANYQNQNLDDSDSYFFSYFMMVCIMFICGYVAYHNKQKILALVVEGRKGRRPSRTRRPNSANYRKLDSNLEEAVTSSCNKNATQVIY